MHLPHSHPEVSCWKKWNSSPSQTDILLSALLSQTPQCLPQDHVCYDSIATCIFTDNCFPFTSTLADAMRSMDVSRSPDSLTSHIRFPCHVPLARVLVCSLSVSRVSLTCTNVDCRLVPGYLFVSRFPFRLVDSSTYIFSLMPFFFRLIDSSMLTVTAYTFPFVVCRLISHLVISGL